VKTRFGSRRMENSAHTDSGSRIPQHAGGKLRIRRAAMQSAAGRNDRRLTQKKNPGTDLLSRVKHYHRPVGFNDRVRNGNGWGPDGMGTGNIKEYRAASGKVLIKTTTASSVFPASACLADRNRWRWSNIRPLVTLD